MQARTTNRTSVAVILLSLIFLPLQSRAAPPVIEYFNPPSLTELNKVTLTWRATGAVGNLAYIYEDIGFVPGKCGTGGCTKSIRVQKPGLYRYTLEAANSDGAISKTVEVFVPPLPAPTFTNDPNVPSSMYTQHVDMFNIQDQTIKWNVHPGSGYIQFKNASNAWTNYATDGEVVIAAADLNLGRNNFSVRYCEAIAPGFPLCSSNTNVVRTVGPSKFDSEVQITTEDNEPPVTLPWSGRIFADNNDTVHLTWSTPSIANTWVWALYTAPATGESTPVQFAWTNDQELDIDTSELDDGFYELDLVSCRYDFSGIDCSNEESPDAIDRLELIVDNQPVDWEYRDWQDDFDAHTEDTLTLPGTGAALDVTIDDDGDVWGLGEFSTRIVQMTDTGVTFHRSPVFRKWDPATSLLVPTGPYIFNAQGQSATSVGGERIISAGNSVWYTQGGGLFDSSDSNHSRIIRFDRTGVDSLLTPDDDRLCAIHLPGGGNNAIGIAHDGERVWVAEARPGPYDLVTRPSAISWFVDDDELGCDNDLDYSDTAAVQLAGQNNACDNPSDQGCIHEILLPGVFVLNHLIVDESAGYLWFTVSTPGAIGRIPLEGTPVVELFRLPTSPSGGLFNGYAWQIRVDAQAVYVGEYGDKQLLRFDKLLADQGGCTELQPDGSNPCVDEISIPSPSGFTQALHSVALENGKLWFTLADEFFYPGSAKSTFGYINTDAWAQGEPTGVIYNTATLATLGSPRPGVAHSFRGIEVNSSGVVVLSDHGYDQLVRLDPLVPVP